MNNYGGYVRPEISIDLITAVSRPSLPELSLKYLHCRR